MAPTKEASIDSKAQCKKDSKTPVEMDPWPDYIHKRLELWEHFMQRHKDELAGKQALPIKITLPDGKVVEGESWRTTPLEVAASISQGLADSTVVAKVNGVVWDLDRPFETDAALQLLKFDSDDAKQVFWHSSAHMLGEALERLYGGCLCYGPPLADGGFYYDMFLADRNVSSDDFPKLETIVKCVIKDKQPFERLVLAKDDLNKLFQYNPFKLRLIEEKIGEGGSTVYRCGPLIDLCRGPHVRHTGKVRAFAVTKNSSAYWQGKADQETLQRVYGISFPDPKQLKQWQKFQEEAAARDHRKLGRDQELFMFHPLSPGSAFFFPKGAHIYHKLVELVRSQYRTRGYAEVISPNMYNARLWEQSGHWQHYEKNLFKIKVEDQQFGLKPMNCPGHCLMFDSRPRTHKELPIRYADFGVLHRNELSGALTGLIRVRRFQQDDGHIFCRMDQITKEIMDCLDFLKFVYVDVFGFDFKLFLSTRPEEGYLGDIQTWDTAETCLRSAMDGFGHAWELNAGDGAFYGPKIDITIFDALRRPHQCATVQLDFQLPERFNLHYSDAEGEKHRPVIVHRAILGSVERMMAILTENFGGKWPFWISPRQAMVIPVHETLYDYALAVRQQVWEAGFECEADVESGDTMNKKIRNAQLAQYNFILVVGEQEHANRTVNVRTRDNNVRGEMTVDELIARFQKLKLGYTKNSEDEF